jgi:hypothetical protein
MSIAAQSVGEAPIAAQAAEQKNLKPPRKRQITAKADAVAQPEPR